MKNFKARALFFSIFICTSIQAAQSYQSIDVGFSWLSSIDVITNGDSPWLAVSSYQSNNIKIFDLNTQSCMRLFSGHTKAVNVLRVSREFSGHNDHVLISGSDDMTVKIWTIEESGTEACRQTLENNLSAVHSLEVFNGCIASGLKDGKIRIWNLATKKNDLTLEGHTDCVQSLLYLGNDILVSGSLDKTIRVWDVNTGQCIKILTGHTNRVFSLCRVDETRIASTSEDKTFIIWDIKSWSILDQQKPNEYNDLTKIAHVKDGVIICGYGADVSIYDCDAKKYIAHDKLVCIPGILALKVFDGKYFVGGVDSQSINIFEVNDQINH